MKRIINFGVTRYEQAKILAFNVIERNEHIGPIPLSGRRKANWYLGGNAEELLTHIYNAVHEHDTHPFLQLWIKFHLPKNADTLGYTWFKATRIDKHFKHFVNYEVKAFGQTYKLNFCMYGTQTVLGIAPNEFYFTTI